MTTNAMVQEARAAYARALAGLEAAGLGPEHVTRVTENVTVAGLGEYADAAGVRAELLGPATTVTTVVVEGLIGSDAPLEVELHTDGGGDGAVHLPTVIPVDEHGDVVAPGDFVAQYRYCLERAGALLERAGLSLGHAVTTYDYSTPDTRAVYRKTHHVRKELLGQNEGNVFPGAGGILMSRLHRPGQLVAIDVTASRHPLELVNPGWSRYDTLTYAPGVKAGRTLYMSGFAALDMETQAALHDGDLGAQAEATYGAILHLLRHAGLGPEHLTRTVEYCVAPAAADFKEVVDVRERLLGGAPTVNASLCDCLLRPEFLLEVFPTALYPEAGA
ncbi:hypothetical protein [Nocardioides sp. YIM 152588]|uniref:RidA family protein n=1 Tax=Nocardioides sp. YIM 152588 TaxID=3158259 RepID=UPI0032E3D1A7